jgi:hypothetical protein
MPLLAPRSGSYTLHLSGCFSTSMVQSIAAILAAPGGRLVFHAPAPDLFFPRAYSEGRRLGACASLPMVDLAETIFPVRVTVVNEKSPVFTAWTAGRSGVRVVGVPCTKQLEIMMGESKLILVLENLDQADVSPS